MEATILVHRQTGGWNAGTFIVLSGIFATVAPSSATCFGSGSFQTCSDNSGNSYTVQRFENQTNMNGNNAQTNSMTLRNTTFHNDITNGNS